MHIDRFESDFDPEILARGKQYFADGFVEELECEDGNAYTGRVQGTDVYELHIELSDQGQILKMSCDCPYDWGDHCKHQAAVLLAIREERKQNTSSRDALLKQKKPDLRTLLLSQPKETLAETLLSLAQQDRGLRRSLLFRFGDIYGDCIFL